MISVNSEKLRKDHPCLYPTCQENVIERVLLIFGNLCNCFTRLFNVFENKKFKKSKEYFWKTRKTSRMGIGELSSAFRVTLPSCGEHCKFTRIHSRTTKIYSSTIRVNVIYLTNPCAEKHSTNKNVWFWLHFYLDYRKTKNIFWVWAIFVVFLSFSFRTVRGKGEENGVIMWRKWESKQQLQDIFIPQLLYDRSN